MGRAHHLRETLLQNIRDNPAGEGFDVEFVVLNYNSQDDLHDWIMSDPEMLSYMQAGTLRYGMTDQPQYYHSAHAKNVAHRIAKGDVLCNLDADNYLGEGFVDFLYALFSQEMNIVVNPSIAASKMHKDAGFYGRVAISAKHFHLLHGYDELIEGYGWDDTNFMQRAKGFGLKHLRFEDPIFLRVIPNTNEERVANMSDPGDAEYYMRRLMRLKGGRSVLRKLFDMGCTLGVPVQANPSGSYGEGIVIFPEDIVHYEAKQGSCMSRFNICVFGLPELLRSRISPRVVLSERQTNQHPEAS